jgi:ribonucleotide monophosphatase NagD (HAD superfamily)
VLAAVEAATGRSADVVVGKPEPAMYLAALDGLPAPVLAVGDRVEVDIAGARAAGLDAALVLTGGALRPTGDDGLRVADSLGALVLA